MFGRTVTVSVCILLLGFWSTAGGNDKAQAVPPNAKPVPAAPQQQPPAPQKDELKTSIPPKEQRPAVPVEPAKPVPVPQKQDVPLKQAQPVPAEQVRAVPVEQVKAVPVEQVKAVPVDQVKAVPVVQQQNIPVKPAQAQPPKQAQPEPLKQDQTVPKPDQVSTGTTNPETPAKPTVAKVVEKPVVAPKVPEKLGVIKAKFAITTLDKKVLELTDLTVGQTVSGGLGSLDANEKLVVKVFATRSLHQVFILLKNKGTKDEVGFVAQLEAEGSNEYKIEVDFASALLQSGDYEVVVYLGDFLIEDSLEWNLGDLFYKAAVVEFQKGQQRPATSALYSISYGEKPEIKHMFRQAEPRPAKAVSDAFTVLVLSPFLFLLILWAKVGVNVKNFPFTLSSLLFHSGLAAIFAVYFLFWWKLTMFEALKWLSAPALVTFVSGNRLLSHIAERRTK